MCTLPIFKGKMFLENGILVIDEEKWRGNKVKLMKSSNKRFRYYQVSLNDISRHQIRSMYQ